MLHKTQKNFNIKVDGHELPNAIDENDVEYLFPIRTTENTAQFEEDNWFVENVGGNTIKWRFYFFENTIQEEELRGVSIFSSGKLIQSPFNFNIRGGISGQHGLEYLFGQVQADFIDAQNIDPISPERQRVNWELPEVHALLKWGQEKVKSTTAEWKRLRAEARRTELEDKVEGFKERLDKLQAHERKTVKSALLKLAEIPTLSKARFHDLGSSFLTAWEKGRLHELIHSIGELGEPSVEDLINILTEAEVLANLQLAEVVRTKIDAIKALRNEVDKRQLENNLRDHVAGAPYLLSPEYDTYKVEKSVKSVLVAVAKSVGFDDIEYNGRIDLALRSAEKLLIVEFVRPGLVLDWGHLDRCERYVSIVAERVQTVTALNIKSVEGLIVADQLKIEDGGRKKLSRLARDGIVALDWKTLLDRAESQWSEFFDVIIERSPKDSRIDGLQAGTDEFVAESVSDKGASDASGKEEN